ncbi:MAG: glycoside hydrolase family 92 protein, partial [Opitutales bacterium]|nr:glycoside hydrolase family 92 protein [Opitutales bacterium]
MSAQNFGEGNIYVKSATLNGKPFDRAWIKHSEILAGGELVLNMASAPSGWAAKQPLPRSLSGEYA